MGLAAGYVHARREMCFALFELSLVHVPLLLHVGRLEREAFAVGVPLTGAPLREEECFVQATREIDDQSQNLLGAATPCQSVALPRVATSGFLTAQSAQGTFRSADSVADKDLLPVEHVPSDFSETILVCMPSAQEISTERTPRVQEIPQADGWHTFVADKFPEEECSRKGTYVSCTLILRGSFSPWREGRPHRKGTRHVARGPPILLAEWRGGSVQPMWFWSALGRNTTLNVEEYRDEQSSVRDWPWISSVILAAPAQWQNPKCFTCEERA